MSSVKLFKQLNQPHHLKHLEFLTEYLYIVLYTYYSDWVMYGLNGWQIPIKKSLLSEAMQWTTKLCNNNTPFLWFH